MTLLPYPSTRYESSLPLAKEGRLDVRGDFCSEGWPVYALQRQLIARGNSLVSDGAFGDRTHFVLKRFQENQGLYVDGVAGPATKTRLAELLCAQVDASRPSLPDGLLRQMSKLEGGDNAAAVNPYDPPTGPHGTDIGGFQIRMIERADGTYSMDDLYDGYDYIWSANEAADRFESAVALYSQPKFTWSRVSLARAQRCALLSHNWPVGANDIAFDGVIWNPDGEAAWVPAGVRMLDGTVVNTRREWVDFYAMGVAPHCGPMPANIKWGT